MTGKVERGTAGVMAVLFYVVALIMWPIGLVIALILALGDDGKLAKRVALASAVGFLLVLLGALLATSHTSVAVV